MMMATAKMMIVIAHWFCNRAQLSPRKNQIETLRQKAADPTRTHSRRMRPAEFLVDIERTTHKAMKSSRAEKIGLKKKILYWSQKCWLKKSLSQDLKKFGQFQEVFEKCFVNVPDIAGRVFIGVLLYWYCALLS